MNYRPQVDASHYRGQSYRSRERWNSYWHQLAFVYNENPETLLEVGVGLGIVARELSATGIRVTTFDIAAELHPDVVGSVTALPFPDKTFDVVLAAEVLEHIRFEDVSQALSELRRVASRAVIISLPHPGYIFSFTFKLPLFPRTELFFKIPFFWKRHQFNGEHYWELGKRGYPLVRFLKRAQTTGLHLKSTCSYADDPAHRLFLFAV